MIYDFHEVFEIGKTEGKAVKQKNYLIGGKYPVIDQGEEFIGGYSNDNSLLLDFKRPVVIFGDHTRRVKYVDFPFIPGADGTKVILAKPLLDGKFAFYQLQSKVIINRGYARHFSELKKERFWVPPIEEQHHIVEILEDHLSRLDAALTYLELASIQINAFEMSSIDKEIESVPCEYLPLRTVIEKIEAGKSFTCLSRKSEPDEWGIIKVSAMTWGEFLPEENKAVPPNREMNIRNQIRQGDILVSRANTEKYVGAPVFVRDEPSRLLLSDKSLRLRPAKGIDPNWLITVLRAPTTRERISARSTGMKDSMRNISQKSLLSVEVPVPIALNDQSEVVRNANEARNASIQLRNAVRDNRKLLGSLRRSLLQAAFTGQLSREAINV